jgi:hypothetical protein
MRLAALTFAVLALSPPAAAQDYPKLKPGQWDLTITTKAAPGAPSTKSSMCTDDAMQKEMMSMSGGMGREMCSKLDFRRDGARWVGNAECKIGESKIISRSVMTLTGDTGYHTEINAVYEPPFMGMKESQTMLDGKYVGPCRDGMVPGDFIGPTGQKFNVKGIASGKGAAMPSPQPARPAKAPQ